MKVAIAVASLALLAIVVGSASVRRGEWDINGEAGSTLVGLALCFVAVILILVALGGLLWF